MSVHLPIVQDAPGAPDVAGALGAPGAEDSRRARGASRAEDTRRVGDARPDPRLRGDRVLGLLELPLLWIDRAIESVVPSAWNPLAQTGAIANVTMLVAVASGVLLLFWYSPSVHTAHASLEAMRDQPVAALVRSMHRYSSDACMLFVALHALRLVGARRFAGARWLAWVTGLVLVGSLWIVGWLGYWLVWDQPARQIALGTSKLVDVVPIFVEPMTRSFLTDRSIQSLLFFIVFFVHMLLPLGMAIAIWLHITRLSRAKFLTRWPMTAAVVASLIIVSLVVPAASGSPAHMLERPGAMAIDAFYLLPIAITDRLGGGALWALVSIFGILSIALPWALSRGRAGAAKVDLAKCNGCTNCAADCPYDAIRMVPRTDGRRFAVEAQVDASKCVGCGICAGSCDSSGIAVPLVSQVEARARIDRWMDAADGEHVAFVCARSAGASIEVDAKSGSSKALPGYRVMPVPCIGWVHALTIERALRHGGRGVLLVGCGSTEPPFREGVRWTRERVEATRAPKLRVDRIDPARVRLVELGRVGRAALTREAKRFREGAPPPAKKGGLARAIALAVIVSALLVPIAALSRTRYASPPNESELVVSFRHAGSNQEHCRDVSEEENAKLPPHMRRARVCERGRARVRLRVEVDGAVRLERAYAPTGLRGDGAAIAIETLPLSPGEHEIVTSIGETHDPNEWTYTDRRRMTLEPHGRAVVLFDSGAGFTWDGI